MPFPNQQFYLKIASVQTGQSALITGEIITVPSGTKTTINSWTEIIPGLYTHPVTLPSGEYIANITVPWESNLHMIPIDVNSGSAVNQFSYGSVIS